MADQSDEDRRRGERLKLPIDPEQALRALLAVDPESKPAEDADDDSADEEERPSGD